MTKKQPETPEKQSEDQEKTYIRLERQQIEKLLLNAADKSSRVLMRLRGDRDIFARVSDQTRSEGRFVLESFEGVSTEELKEISGSSSQYSLLIFISGQIVLGLHTYIDGHYGDDGKLFFAIPSTGYRIQRRKFARYTIPAGYEYIVEVPAADGSRSLRKCRLLDLSSKGLSFRVVSPREAALYEKGRMLRGIRWTLLGQLIAVDGQVRNRIAAKDRNGASYTKIGVEFIRVSPADAEMISNFVLAHVFEETSLFR